MSETYDLVVIGAGMAGVAAANKCGAAGWRVAIVDALPYGGTCALRGCDPKKILRRGAEIVDAARLRGESFVRRSEDRYAALRIAELEVVCLDDLRQRRELRVALQRLVDIRGKGGRGRQCANRENRQKLCCLLHHFAFRIASPVARVSSPGF